MGGKKEVEEGLRKVGMQVVGWKTVRKWNDGERGKGLQWPMLEARGKVADK
jgi:hypothetical protein